MYIRWISDPAENSIFFSPVTVQKFKINSSKITLHIGAWKEKLTVRLLADLNQNTVGLPGWMAQFFTLPDNLLYDMYMEKNNLHLGPVIAFVVGENHLSPKQLGFWEDYCRNYRAIRGLICLCTTKGIDFDTGTVSGYYYDPNAEQTKRWRPGKFPLPGVVYRRTKMRGDFLRNLNRHVNGKVFNARVFDKWNMWKVLSQAGFSHTPHTVLLEGPDSLRQMLSSYGAVYLKPAKGRLGIGIQKIEKIPDGYLFRKESGTEQTARGHDQLYQLVNRYRKERKYIIQQAVPLIFHDKPVDFRVILQKDRSRKWTCSGIFAKLGYRGRIYTNTPSAIYSVSKALRTIYGLNRERALKKEKEIIRICVKACRIIERAYGIYADVGIDVVVDKDLNIWILEINKLHQHTMVKNLQKDPDMYHRVITKPLEYAKALAGFK